MAGFQVSTEGMGQDLGKHTRRATQREAVIDGEEVMVKFSPEARKILKALMAELPKDITSENLREMIAGRPLSVTMAMATIFYLGQGMNEYRKTTGDPTAVGTRLTDLLGVALIPEPISVVADSLKKERG